MEQDFVNVNALAANLVEQALGEVQPGGGCGDTAGFAGIDRLVALLVQRAVGAVDVGGKGKVTELEEQIQHVGSPLEHHGSTPVRVDREDAGAFSSAQFDRGPHLELSARSHEGAERSRAGGFGKEVENLGLAASDGLAKESGGHYAASVNDQ